MPVQDLTGTPSLTAQEKALIIELHGRLGIPLPRRPGYRGGDGLEPVPSPPDPKPSPSMGGAEATVETALQRPLG